MVIWIFNMSWICWYITSIRHSILLNDHPEIQRSSRRGSHAGLLPLIAFVDHRLQTMFSVTLLGDVMLGRLNPNKPQINEKIIQYLKESTLNIANLECVITNNATSLQQLQRNPKEFMCKHGGTTKQADILRYSIQ